MIKYGCSFILDQLCSLSFAHHCYLLFHCCSVVITYPVARVYYAMNFVGCYFHDGEER